jgi:hypothetical protein
MQVSHGKSAPTQRDQVPHEGCVLANFSGYSFSLAADALATSEMGQSRRVWSMQHILPLPLL